MTLATESSLPEELEPELDVLEGEYKATIGLEVHCQLATETKLFSRAKNEFGGEPNTHVGEVDAGLPGALPSVNRRAVDLAVAAGLALGCDISSRSRFDRKQYFFPDLPKGYQITQEREPLARDGTVGLVPQDAPGDTTVQNRSIGVERVHLEEDAAKSTHVSSGGDGSERRCIDLNRSGVPLIEIVSRPEMRTPVEAVVYLKELRRTMVHLGVTDGVMAEGSMRCDANVSVAAIGDETDGGGTRVELKNINSFKFVKDGLTWEIGRQVRMLENGEEVAAETRGYDPDEGRTYRLRTKETDADYRYMVEADLPPVRVSDARRARIGSQMSETPARRRRRFREQFELDGDTAAVLADRRAVARFAEECLQLSEHPGAMANWIVQDVMRVVDPPESGGLSDVTKEVMTPEKLAELLALRESDEVSDNATREVFDAIAERPAGDKPSPTEVVEERSLRQLSDRAALEEVVDEVFEQNPEQADELRGGDDNLVGWFVGQIMQQTGGSADPKMAKRLIIERVGGEDEHSTR